MQEYLPDVTFREMLTSGSIAGQKLLWVMHAMELIPHWYDTGPRSSAKSEP